MSSDIKYLLLLKEPNASKGEQDNFVNLLEKNHWVVTCVAALEFSFINLDDLEKALHRPDQFSCLVFTSPRTVDAIHRAVKTDTLRFQDAMHQWNSRSVYCVGKGTAASAQTLGFNPKGMQSGSAEKLADIIINDLNSNNITRQPVLHPCGSLSLDTLRDKLFNSGLTVQSITVYETVASTELDTNISEYLSSCGVPDVTVFFSPSGVNFLHAVLEKLNVSLEKSKLVAIGPTTTAALQRVFGRVNGTATTPTPEGLVDVLKELAV